MRKISFKYPGSTFSISYPNEIAIPKTFEIFLGEIAFAYYIAATRPGRINLANFTNPIAQLVIRYFEVNKIPVELLGHPKMLPASMLPEEFKELDPNGIALGLSGGKDSVYLGLEIEKKHGMAPFCFYAENVNRSESFYESKATRRISDEQKWPYTILDISNGIRLNREGHNIAFREEIAFACAIPYLIHHNRGLVYFGSFNSFTNIDPPMYASSREALELVCQRVKQLGYSFAVSGGTDFDMGVIDPFEKMVKNHFKLLQLTSSCYTQINFREQRHEALQAKMPHIPIYNGCGNCVKCCRLNAAILNWHSDKDTWPENERNMLLQHLRVRKAENFGSDSILKQLLHPLI